MTIAKRGKYFHYRFMYRGELYHGSTGETSRTAAIDFENEYRRSIKNGTIKPGMEMPSLGEFITRFELFVEKSEELKPKTKRSYLNGCRLLKAHASLLAMDLDEINGAAASTLKFPGGGSNANQALRTLRRMLSLAKEIGVLRDVPTINLRDENERMTTVDPWIEALLLEFASPVLRDVIVTGLGSGMRPDEIGRMQWSDINWLDNTILVQRGKTLKARRLVPLTQRMREMLSARKRENERLAKNAGRPVDNPWVFPSPRAKDGHVSNFTHLWGRTIKRVQKAIKARRLPPLTPGIVLYSTRHTFATTFLKTGGDVGTLMRIMGHTNIQTTQKYLHLVEAGEAAAVMNRHDENKKLILLKRGA